MDSQDFNNLKQIMPLFDDINANSEDELRRYSSHVNVKNYKGENSLHILAGNINNDNFENVFEMMGDLLSHGCNPNYPNFEGKTAFYILLEKVPELERKQEILDLFLQVNSEVVDFYVYKSDEIIEMVKKQIPDFEFPEKSAENETSYESMEGFLMNSKINKFETNFWLFKSSCENDESFQNFCSIFMQIAIEKSLINIVDLLINAGFDVNKKIMFRGFQISPIFAACRTEDSPIFKLFLMHPKINLIFEDEKRIQRTLLHQFFEERKTQSYSSFRRMESREMTRNSKKCFDLLLKHPKCDRNFINALDEGQNPAIFYSVRYKNDYVTLELLKKGAYIGPIVDSIRSNLLEEFLDSRISTNDRFYDEEDLEIKIDFSFLSPSVNNQIQTANLDYNNGKNSETQVKISEVSKFADKIQFEPIQYSQEVKSLKGIAESPELQHLLTHPTLASFVLLKWKTVSFLVYINMIIIMTFILSFVPFAYLCQNLKDEEKSSSFFYIFFQVISITSLSCLVIRELSQAVLSVKKYVFDYSNWVDICLMGFASTILLFDRTLPDGELGEHISRVLRTIVILLATAEYFGLLGMLPILSISIHTKMFKKVCQTFINYLAFYSILIIAFALSFYNLHGDYFAKDLHKTIVENKKIDAPYNNLVTNTTRSERFNNFGTIGSSIIKSFVMLAGELETSYVSQFRTSTRITLKLFYSNPGSY